MLPRSDQRLFEAQPPSTTPYTPREAMASTKRIPTFNSAACRLMVRSPIWRTSPNGMTAKGRRAGTRLTSGASVCSSRSTAAGVMSSFSRNLIGSATSVFTRPRPAKPRIAARLAPIRSWMTALTLRSKNTPSPTTCNASRMPKSALPAVVVASTATLGAGETLDQLERPGDGEVLMVLGVVHLQDGCRPAGRQTLDLLEGEAAVGGSLAVADAEAALDGHLDRPCPAQRARQVAAELDVPAALRLLPVHRVEGGYRRDPGERQLHQRGHVLHHRQGEPAELALREPEGRHEGGAPLRVAREERAVLGERRLRETRPLSGHTRPRPC